MKDEIIVTVITPAYNAANFIANVYKSLSMQKIKNLEWIVIDDYSNDETALIIESFIHCSDFKIILIKNKCNLGAAYSRNKALDIAVGKYVCFLDADDTWCDDKLLIQISGMEKQNISVSYMDYMHVDTKGNFLKNIISPNSCIRNDLLKSNCIGNLTCMVKRDIILDIRFMKHGHEDYIFWLHVLSKVSVAYKIVTEEPLCKYTVSNNSLSGNKIQAAKWQWRIYRKVLKINLLKSYYYFFIYAIKGLLKHKF